MKTVWDLRNQKWVNVPAKWLEEPGAEALWQAAKPIVAPLEKPVGKEPAKAKKKEKTDA